MKRLIAIGDIHGQLSKLLQLLLEVRPTGDDQLVFLGDYIDRGPDSRGVIKHLVCLRDEFPQTVFLRGNHEQMLLDAMIEAGVIEGQRLRERSPLFAASAEPSDLKIFMMNGGRTTLTSYIVKSLEDGLPKQHIDFLQQTLFWWRHEQFLFVHAGVQSGLPVEQQDLDFLLWSRHCDPGKDGEIHVVGHNPTTNKKPLFEEGRYSLDTGAAYSYALTACDVLTKKVWQVD